MADIAEEAEPAPPPPGPNKVEITVAGHSVVVESSDPLADVVGYAMGIYEQTRLEAKRIPLGFDIGVAQVEYAAPYTEPGRERWEDEADHRSARDGGTRKMIPGHYRTRLPVGDQNHR